MYPPSGKRARAEANLAAIDVLRTLETEERAATAAEQETLAKWSSWGALPEVFEGWREDWQDVQLAVREALTNDEYNAAMSTTLNAHYTDPGVVQQVWQGLEHAGFTGGPVLEPGCGSGTFIGLAPESAQMVGVELDPVTAKIAGGLYPDTQVRVEGFEKTRLEGEFNAVVGNVPFGGFSLYDPMDNPRGLSIHNHFIVKSLKATAPGGYVAVLTSSFTMDAKRSTARREMAKYGDLVGAVRLPTGAFERVSGTSVVTDVLVMRRRDPDQQVNVNELPWVGTTMVEAAPGRGNDDQGPLEIEVNAYWQAHPEHVLGTLCVGQGMYGNDTVEVKPAPDVNLSEQVGTAITSIVDQGRAKGLGYEPVPTVPALAELTTAGMRYPIPLQEQVRPGHVREAEKVGTFEAWSGVVWEPMKVARTGVGETRSLLQLRDAAVGVVDSQRSQATDAEREQGRQRLHLAYDGYANTYGPINRFDWSQPRAVPQTKIDTQIVARSKAWRAALPASLDAIDRAEATVPPEQVTEWETEISEGAKRSKRQPHLSALRSDPQFALVLALEDFDEATNEARKTRIFTEDVVGRAVERTEAQSPADALAICLDEQRKVDLARIGTLLNLDEAATREALGNMVFDDPATGEIEPAVRYLSGDVRSKLELATDAAVSEDRFARNVDALRDVVPVDVSLSEVSIRPGARYVTIGDYQRFTREVFKADVDVTYSQYDSSWTLDGPARKAYDAQVSYNFGVDKRTPVELLEAVMNNTPVTLTKVIDDVHGKERRVRDVQATTLAREKCEQITKAFGNWIGNDPQRADRIEVEYNKRFNAHVSPDYSDQGKALALDGLSPSFVPHHYQRESVARIVNEPSVLLDHVVGAGKTGTMIMGAMELRRTGIARKPWVVVPNHLVEQIASEWKEWYPTANVMAVPTGCNPAQRREWVAKSAASDWDGVVVPASVFKRINVDQSRSAEWLQQDLDLLRDELGEAQGKSRTGDKDKRVKAIAKQIKTVEARYEKVFESKDEGLTFESSGCDYLFVDEAHNYKNLGRASAHAELACTGSDQALDLDHKLRALRESKIEAAERQGMTVEHYLPAVATFATGTPVANSLSEMWVMQHYLRPDMLNKADISTVDAWAGQFAQGVTKLEIGPDGSTWRMKDRIAAFRNAPELLALTQQFASVVTRADITAALPTLDGGTRQLVSRPASEHVKEYVAELAHRANNLPSDPSIDNLLKVTNDGRMVALDPQMQRLAPDADGGRLGDMATKIMELDSRYATTTYNNSFGETAPLPGGLQLVFADRGTPKTDGRFSTYDALRDELVTRGMDRSKIRFVHEAGDDDERGELFEACRDGRVSVLIGSTEKMGTGVNVQQRATALHHMDCPYRPADLEQREGRVLRQGNQNKTTHIYQYVTEGTYDAVMWQIVARKAAFISQVRTKRITGRIIEDLSDDMTISAAAASAVATGDPRIVERAEVIANITSLESLEQGFLTEQTNMAREDRQAGSEVARLNTERPRLNELTQQYTSTAGDGFALTTGEGTYRRRVDAAGALHHTLRSATTTLASYPERRLPLATVGGIDLELRTLAQDKGYVVQVAGLDVHGTTLTQAETKGDLMGVVRRLEGTAASVNELLASNVQRTQRLTERREQIQNIDHGEFPRTEELRTLRARLDVLDHELEMASEEKQQGTTEPERLEGDDLTRAYGKFIQAEHLLTGDVITGLPRQGMWQLLEPDGYLRWVHKVGNPDDRMELNTSGEHQLVSRLEDNVTDLHRALLADPTAKGIRSYQVQNGQRITVAGRPIILEEGEPVQDKSRLVTLTGTVNTRASQTPTRGMRDTYAITDDQGQTTNLTVQERGGTFAVLHDAITPPTEKEKNPDLTLTDLLPGDALTAPVEPGPIPEGTVVSFSGRGQLALMHPETGETYPTNYRHTGVPVEAATGRSITAEESETLWPDAGLAKGVTVADLRVGDEVNSQGLDSKNPFRQRVVVRGNRPGGMREVSYSPVDEPGAERTTARRREDQQLPVLARRFGALRDHEVRQLQNPNVEVVSTEDLMPGTENVVLYGDPFRESGRGKSVFIGTYQGEQGPSYAPTRNILTEDQGVIELGHTGPSAVIYPPGETIPPVVDRTGTQPVAPPKLAPQPPAAPPRRTSVAGVDAHSFASGPASPHM